MELDTLLSPHVAITWRHCGHVRSERPRIENTLHVYTSEGRNVAI